MKDYSDKEVDRIHYLKKSLTEKQKDLRGEIMGWHSQSSIVASLQSHTHVTSTNPKEIRENVKEANEAQKKLLKDFDILLKKHNATLADIQKVLTKEEWRLLWIPPKYQEEKKKLE